jgi:hypothetical protein
MALGFFAVHFLGSMYLLQCITASLQPIHSIIGCIKIEKSIKNWREKSANIQKL